MHITERSVVRALIWLVSLTGFLWQASIILKMYSQYPFSVTVVEELQKGIMFPALTVCMENWQVSPVSHHADFCRLSKEMVNRRINKSAFCSLDKSNCAEGDQPRRERLATLAYDLEAQAKVAVSAVDMFECYLRSSDPTCSAIRCRENIARTYYRHPNHMCYTLDFIEYAEIGSTFLQCKAPWTWELEMNVYWSTKESAAIEETNKFPVIVHRPETCLPDKLSAIVGEAGVAYVLSVTNMYSCSFEVEQCSVQWHALVLKQQTVKRLPPPYASKCTDYAKYGRHSAYGGFMNQDTCLQDCYVRLQTKHCGCVDPTLGFAGRIGATACSPGNGEICVASLSENSTLKICRKKCRAPCKDTTYDVRLTGMGAASNLHAKFITSDEIKLFGLVIKFSSDTQKIFVYEPNLTIVEAFGYMGGYLGMWLGFSLLSILRGLEQKILDFFFGADKVTSIRIPRMNLHSSTVVRVLVWLCCMCGFLYQTSEIIEMYRRYPFTVTIIEEVRQNILFPAITVCVESWINTTRLCELYPTMCTVEAQTLADDVYQIQFDPEMRHRVALEQRDLFRCSMRSTVSSCLSFNCLEVMRMTYFRPPASMCYTVDSNQWSDQNHRFHKCNVPWTWELSIRAAWTPGKVMQLQATDKLPLVIHRSETCPPDRLSSITVKPGLTYTVSVAQQTVRRLPPPFASRCSDYKAAGPRKEFLGYLTQDLCIQDCLIKEEIKTCRCVRPQHEYGSNFNVSTCTYQGTAVCDKQITNKTITKCMKKCGAPCEETTYDVRLTSLGEDRKEKERNSFSVYVKFSSDSQKIFEYQPKLTLIEAFGYMGGYIGMWLGLSLYSLITDAEQYLRSFLLKRAQKRKEPMKKSSTPQPRVFTTSGGEWRMASGSGNLASGRNGASSPKHLLRVPY